MQGNLHVQFLGGQARATAPGYPAMLVQRWPRKFGQSDKWNVRGLSRR
jgi:hypothetical protein